MNGLIPLNILPLFLSWSLALLLIPGPAVLYIIARSVDRGRKAGLASVLGIEIGTLFQVIAAALGLSAILWTSEMAFNVVKYAGAAYLIYLGIRKLLTKVETPSDQPVEPQSLRRAFTQGVVVNLLNPKVTLFFIAFLPQFVDPARGSVALQILILGMIFILLATCTDSMYALAAGTAAGWLRGNPAFLRFEKYFAGTMYIGLGLTAALSQGSKD